MKSARPPRPMRRDELRKFKNIVVVFGSRQYNDYDIFSTCVEGYIADFSLSKETTVFVTGKADSGPDSMIITWCIENGWAWHEMPADWDNLDAPGAVIKTNNRGKQYNAKAGFDRNREMANIATHSLGFWDGTSPGTKDMVGNCKAKETMKNRLIRTPEKVHAKEQESS